MSYQYTHQQTWTWNGHSFTIYPPNSTWNQVAGIYIFAGQGQWGWNAVYVGQTDSFAVRLSCHERWAEAQRLGATHVHAMTVQQQWQRDAIEQQLVRLDQPPLNLHYR